MINRKTILQFIRFGFNGTCAAVVHYSCLIVLIEICKINPLIATSIGFCFGLSVAYALNSKYTFKDYHRNNIVETVNKKYSGVISKVKKHKSTFSKYALSSTCGLILNTTIFGFLIDAIHLHYLISQIVATLVVMFWNFTLCKLWIFRKNDYAE